MAFSITEELLRQTVWRLVPEAVKRRVRKLIGRNGPPPWWQDLPPLEVLKRRYEQIIDGTATSLVGHELELSTPEEVDGMIGWAHHAAKHKGGDGLSAFIDSFRFRFPNPPGDPISTEYRDFWMAQYEAMARKAYRIENEHHDFDADALRKTPYPYNTRNQKVIAAHIIAAGAILESIPAPPPAKVLELGVGFGNTSLQMGLSGYDVTVVDIEQKFLDIVAARFKQEELDVRSLHLQFLDIGTIEDKFDAVVFYESFHHCIDNVRLLALVRERLAPNGAIIFAGETISKDLPYAWGLNPSGQGIWSIRHHGWMELVFQESYFLDLLKRSGFKVSRNNFAHSAHSVVYTAVLA